MKRIYLICLLAAFILMIYSCSEDTSGPSSDSQDKQLKTIVHDYTLNTVIKTYSLMADEAIKFNEDCISLSNLKTDAAVVKAAESWKTTREHWEKSEAFLYGPANINNIDPLIDSWPLDKNRLDQILAMPDIMTIDAAYVRENLGSSLRGFHAVEYVIFSEGEPRKASSITPAEMKFLLAVAEVLRDDCILLEASWSGISAISSQKQAFLTVADISTSSNYGYEMINAGLAGSRYASVQLAIDEIVQGCMDIADEVGNAKIAEPAQSGNVLDVESWYSWKSHSDFKNNIKSIENSYLGGIENSRGTGLTEFVKSKNPALDIEIKKLIGETIIKIGDIGEPFRNNLNNTEKINIAIESCTKLMTSFQKIKELI